MDTVHAAAGGHVGVVRDDQQGQPVGVQHVQQGQYGARRSGVQVPGGLVAQQQRGFGDQGAGDGHALALAARHPGREMAGAVAEADPLQRRTGPVGALRARDAVVDHGEADVLQGAAVRQEMEGLEDEADALPAQGGPVAVAQGAGVDAVEQVPPRGRGVDEPRDVQEGGLPGAGGADHGDVLAALHGQFAGPQCLDGRRSGVGEADALEADDRGGVGRGARRGL